MFQTIHFKEDNNYENHSTLSLEMVSSKYLIFIKNLEFNQLIVDSEKTRIL
jgi:hypothetical protein